MSDPCEVSVSTDFLAFASLPSPGQRTNRACQGAPFMFPFHNIDFVAALGLLAAVGAGFLILLLIVAALAARAFKRGDEPIEYPAPVQVTGDPYYN